MKPNTQTEIYTDGSCLGNPGPGGWAAVISTGETQHELSGGSQETTNNRMELLAVICSLESLEEPQNVTIYSDSRYVVDAINKGWLENWKRTDWHLASGGAVKNPDLWTRLDGLLALHTCTFQWVKGHAGNPLNEICDTLANKRAAEYASGALQEDISKPVETVTADRSEEHPGQPEENLSYTVEAVLSALDSLITGLNQRKFDGITRPCGARDCCEHCESADIAQYPCALAYLRAREKEVELR